MSGNKKYIILSCPEFLVMDIWCTIQLVVVVITSIDGLTFKNHHLKYLQHVTWNLCAAVAVCRGEQGTS